MHPDLEAIVSADEEARSRVTLEEDRRARELSEVRTVSDASIDSRRRAESDALETELRVIREDGDARIAALQRQQSEFLSALAANGERRFDEAVAVFLRITGEVHS